MKLGSAIFRSVGLHVTVIVLIAIGIYWHTQRNLKTPLILIDGVTAIEVKKTIEADLAKAQAAHEQSLQALENMEPDAVAPKVAGSGPVSESKDTAVAVIPPDELQKYIAILIERIHQAKEYPKSALKAEEEGLVEISITIAPDGRMVRSELIRSSSFQALDQSAIAVINKLGTLPALPLNAEGKAPLEPIVLKSPIQFKLK